MKIELKKISFNERMSEETICFVADLYINGKKVGYAKNYGHGGCTDYHGYTKEDNQVIAQAEAHFLSLPKVMPNGYTFMLQPTLENAIDEQLEMHLSKKELKKMEKEMETAILFGVPNAEMYVRIKFKTPLVMIPTNLLQKKLDEIKKNECKDGVVILNTNLEKLGVTV